MCHAHHPYLPRGFSRHKEEELVGAFYSDDVITFNCMKLSRARARAHVCVFYLVYQIVNYAFTRIVFNILISNWNSDAEKHLYSELIFSFANWKYNWEETIRTQYLAPWRFEYFAMSKNCVLRQTWFPYEGFALKFSYLRNGHPQNKQLLSGISNIQQPPCLHQWTG